MILRPLDRLHENDGFDDQSRFLLSLNDFAERESSTLLDTIFYYWDALRGGSDKVPNVRHFELRNVFGQNTPDALSAVVTDTANPRNFVLVNHGTSQLGPFGADLEENGFATSQALSMRERPRRNINNANCYGVPSIMK